MEFLKRVTVHYSETYARPRLNAYGHRLLRHNESRRKRTEGKNEQYREKKCRWVKAVSENRKPSCVRRSNAT